jgi:hypothetical protein
MAATKRPARKKLLSDADFTAIMRTALGQDDSYSRIVALLVLTGQRRGEITALECSWIKSDRTVALPDWMTRTRLSMSSRSVPLLRKSCKLSNPQATEDIFPRVRVACPGVRRPRRLTLGQSLRWNLTHEVVTGWTLHDLRRAFATRLADLQVLPHVIERLLNHKLGSIQPAPSSALSLKSITKLPICPKCGWPSRIPGAHFIVAEIDTGKDSGLITQTASSAGLNSALFQFRAHPIFRGDRPHSDCRGHGLGFRPCRDCRCPLGFSPPLPGVSRPGGNRGTARLLGIA